MHGWLVTEAGKDFIRSLQFLEDFLQDFSAGAFLFKCAGLRSQTVR